MADYWRTYGGLDVNGELLKNSLAIGKTEQKFPILLKLWPAYGHIHDPNWHLVQFHNSIRTVCNCALININSMAQTIEIFMAQGSNS